MAESVVVVIWLGYWLIDAAADAATAGAAGDDDGHHGDANISEGVDEDNDNDDNSKHIPRL